MWDMPTIPMYHYTTTQLWPPERVGMHINSRDIHPPKVMRWKDDERPRGGRYEFFPRIPNRSTQTSP